MLPEPVYTKVHVHVGESTNDEFVEEKTPDTLPLNFAVPVRFSVTFEFVPLLNVQNVLDVEVGSVRVTVVPDVIR